MADLFDAPSDDGGEFENLFAGDAERVTELKELAEAAAPKEWGGEEIVPEQPETAPEAQPRDEHGRFAAKTEVETIPEEQPEVEEAPTDDLAAYLAKYGGDQEKALRAAIEAQSELGRRATEIGELRSRDAQWQAYVEQLEQSRQQAQFTGQVDWESEIAENPARAAKLAAMQNNEWAYQQAVRAWDEISPGAPELWLRSERLEHQLSQIASAERSREGQKELANLTQKYPDITSEDWQNKMAEIVPNNPIEAEALNSGDMRKIAWATENLYLKARGLAPMPDTLAETAQQLARVQAEEEQRVREEATVVSSTRTNAAPPLTAAEAIAADWPDDERRLNQGWNIG